MRRCRPRFKYALRQRKRYKETHKADALAKSILETNYEILWKDVKTRNNSKVPLPKVLRVYLNRLKLPIIMWMKC